MAEHRFDERLSVWKSNGGYAAACVCGYVCRPKAKPEIARQFVMAHVQRRHLIEKNEEVA